jgi:hypothetical protein
MCCGCSFGFGHRDPGGPAAQRLARRGGAFFLEPRVGDESNRPMLMGDCRESERVEAWESKRRLEGLSPIMRGPDAL